MQLEANDGSPDNADRRRLLQHVGLLLGTTALPASALLGAEAAGARRFLDAPTFQLLSAVSDTIVPRTDTAGAVEAGVPAVIDSLLRNWASAATRAQLGDALRRIDAAALAQAGHGFARMDRQARLALLRTHDAEALQPAPAGGARSIEAMLAGPAARDAGYARLKELIVTLYYSSKAGLTQELPYVHAPGRWQPSIPVTKDTRPAGGGGMF